MKTILPTLFLSAILVERSIASSIEIKLKPMVDIPEVTAGGFDGFFFEPYNPSPNTERKCYDSCPCGGTPSKCGCDLEIVCGGSFLADLSTQDTISFHWDASSDDTKYISIQGSGRTRIEFQATYDCAVSPGEVEILGTDIEFEIDDDGLDASSQSFVYNSEESFVLIGKCDGCAECEIYTRLQFDPKDDVLDLNLKSLKFSGDYDSSRVIQGEFDYEWSTSGYCWMRDSQDRRRDRSLEESNTYRLLDLPTDISGTSSIIHSSVWLGYVVAIVLALCAL